MNAETINVLKRIMLNLELVKGGFDLQEVWADDASVFLRLGKNVGVCGDTEMEYQPISFTWEEMAARNSLILNWLHNCEPIFIHWVCCARAKELECPVCEIDSDFTDAVELDWLWQRFQATISLFKDDSL